MTEERFCHHCGALQDDTLRPIPGYPGYLVSEYGDVFRVRITRLKGGRDVDGYPRVNLARVEESTGRVVWAHTPVHRVVCESWRGSPEEGQVVRHLDGDPRNNALENLAWGSQSENQRDTVRHGRHPHASKTHCPSGHAYSEENTYRSKRPDGGWERQCRICRKDRSREYYLKKQRGDVK